MAAPRAAEELFEATVRALRDANSAPSQAGRADAATTETVQMGLGMTTDYRMTGPLRERLRQLARDAWQEHQQAERERFPALVRPSMPILYFGDSAGYAGSPLRVITVGLNPSREEFPRGDPFSRFPGQQAGPPADVDAYMPALDGYFRANPYVQWFDPSFEPILRGLGASYYAGQQLAALHTDLCSPLATDPTWSRLKGDQAFLERAGTRLWHDLAEALQPDVVLVSVARHRLAQIASPATGPATVIHTVDGPCRRRPYHVEAQPRRLGSGKEPLFVFGAAAQQPFGLISREDKIRAGRSIREAIR
jgi:hypothetical protein